MAKKAAAKGDFNLSAALRDIHSAHPEMMPKDLVAEVKRRNPGQDINEKTAAATASSVRSGGKKGGTRGGQVSGGIRRGSPTNHEITVKDIESALAIAKDHFKGSIDDAVLQLEALRTVGDLDHVLKSLHKARELQALLVGRK